MTAVDTAQAAVQVMHALAQFDISVGKDPADAGWRSGSALVKALNLSPMAGTEVLADLKDRGYVEAEPRKYMSTTYTAYRVTGVSG